MKQSRHIKILEIVENKEVTTQDELVDELSSLGVDVTQATISRDIKELKLVKVMGTKGEYKYTVLKEPDKTSFDNLIRFVKEVLLSIDFSENIVCLKMVDGSASLVAKVIDSLEDPEIVGTVSGNDTVFILMRTREYIPEFIKRFEKLI